MTQGNAETAAAGASGLLRSRRVDRVLTVGLNRPAKRNALNDGIILEIGECFASSARGHRRGRHPRHRRPFLLRSRPVRTAGPRRHRRPAAFADVAPGVRPYPVQPRARHRRAEGRGDRRRAGARLRRPYPRRRALGLFRAARGPARHLRRRRRLGAAAAADRRRADDGHDADRAASIPRPRARPTALRNMSRRPATASPRRWSLRPRSPPTRR